MVATSYIVPDFETGYSGFYFWRNNEGNNKTADDRKLCKPVASHARADYLIFFTKLLIFSTQTTLPIFFVLCNSIVQFFWNLSRPSSDVLIIIIITNDDQFENSVACT